MATFTVNAAAIGTVLATGVGTITGLTITQPAVGAITDTVTPITLLDAAAAPIRFAPTLFSATMAALAFLWDQKPGMTLSPGLTPVTWPRSLGTFTTPRVNGVYVASCPAGVTLTLTT
jgi:hypothetical protein